MSFPEDDDNVRDILHDHPDSLLAFTHTPEAPSTKNFKKRTRFV